MKKVNGKKVSPYRVELYEQQRKKELNEIRKVVQEELRNLLKAVKNSDWVGVVGIADHLGVSKETIYRFLEKEKIPSHRIGRQWKFKKSEVDEWIISGGAE